MNHHARAALHSHPRGAAQLQSTAHAVAQGPSQAQVAYASNGSFEPQTSDM
jgi:hypothetical protein